MLRFRTRPYAFTCDVSMAYNGIKLRYQKYIWIEDLKPENPVKIMVVKTLIYGVKSAGNQLGVGFSKLGEHYIRFHPEHKGGAQALLKDAYDDDILHACWTRAKIEKEAESLQFILSRDGLSVKAVTYSGVPPLEIVSADQTNIRLVGMVWNSDQDTIELDIKPLYFCKAKRGKVPELVQGDVKAAQGKVFTRRTLTGKLAGVLDPLGVLTPLTAGWKLDLRRVSMLGLDWDDKIQDSYLDTWVRNLEDISSAKEIRFRRAVIPPSAKSTAISIITSSDASKNIAVACVHARVQLQDGSYHTQLLTVISKIVNTDTIPKAELKGAVMGASLSFTARSNLGPAMNTSLYVTDSTIVLYWVNQDQRPLQN